MSNTAIEMRTKYLDNRTSSMRGLSDDIIINCAKYAIQDIAQNSLPFLRDEFFEVERSDFIATTITIESKKIRIKVNNNVKLYLLYDNIAEKIVDLIRNPRKKTYSLFPFSLEMLYNGVVPNKSYDILEYYNEDNLTYIKIRYTRFLTTQNKYGSYMTQVEEEVVIEKYANNYKTKRGKSFENFKKIALYKTAPKANKITIKYNNLSHTGDNVTTKFTQVGNNEVILEINDLYTFRGKHMQRIDSVVRSWLHYKKDNVYCIKSRMDIYNSGYTYTLNLPTASRYLEEIYYFVNEYGGLSSSTEKPEHLKIEESDILPEPDVIPSVSIEDLYLNLSEDETTIINQFEDHPYISIDTIIDTPEVKVYETRNKVYNKSMNFEQHFVKCGNIWVHTVPANKKVKQAINAYNLAQKLSEIN